MSPDSPAIGGRHDGQIGAVEHLGSVLERIANALVALDCQAMLSLEADLARAIKSLDQATPVGDGEALMAAAHRVQRALLRCRRLGGSLSGISRTLARARGATVAYDRAGGVVGSLSLARAVQVSV
jgi:hypothetical protein